MKNQMDTDEFARGALRELSPRIHLCGSSSSVATFLRI